jgi:hypothetical protein
LLFDTRQRSVHASPTRCAGCPNRHRRARKIRIIEGSNPNEDQMRSCLCLAKERRTAVRAKSAVHSVAAVCHAREVACLPYNLECRGAKASTNRSAACAQVLAVSAPAHARDDRRLRALPSNRAAKTSPGHCHRTLQGWATLRRDRTPLCHGSIQMEGRECGDALPDRERQLGANAWRPQLFGAPGTSPRRTSPTIAG